MPCLDCTEYANFYSILGSNVMVFLSIIAVLFVYLIQRRSETREDIENEINDLIKLIDKFYDIVKEVKPFADKSPSTTATIVMNRYLAEGHEGFLKELDTLQIQIFDDFVEFSRKNEGKKDLDNKYETKINIDNIKSWINGTLPFLNGVDRTRRSIDNCILVNKYNWSDFYRWEKKYGEVF